MKCPKPELWVKNLDTKNYVLPTNHSMELASKFLQRKSNHMGRQQWFYESQMKLPLSSSRTSMMRARFIMDPKINAARTKSRVYIEFTFKFRIKDWMSIGPSAYFMKLMKKRSLPVARLDNRGCPQTLQPRPVDKRNYVEKLRRRHYIKPQMKTNVFGEGGNAFCYPYIWREYIPRTSLSVFVGYRWRRDSLIFTSPFNWEIL